MPPRISTAFSLLHYNGSHRYFLFIAEKENRSLNWSLLRCYHFLTESKKAIEILGSSRLFASKFYINYKRSPDKMINLIGVTWCSLALASKYDNHHFVLFQLLFPERKVSWTKCNVFYFLVSISCTLSNSLLKGITNAIAHWEFQNRLNT